MEETALRPMSKRITDRIGEWIAFGEPSRLLIEPEPSRSANMRSAVTRAPTILCDLQCTRDA